jgi:hypothetical protein
MRHLKKLALIVVNKLPEQIIIRTEHQAAALGAEGHAVIETSQH